MSTKAIREALDMVDTDHPNMTDAGRKVVQQALADVERIEKAAPELLALLPDSDREHFASVQLLERIAKESAP